jgi:hypothetical protein
MFDLEIVAEMRIQDFMREAQSERLVWEALSDRRRAQSALKRIATLVTLLGL